MSRTVYKYQLSYEPMTIVGGDPRVVHVGIDPAGADLIRPTVWVELAPDGEDSITLCFIGTGHTVPALWGHVGSAIATTTAGSFVWHVYKKEWW